MPNLSGKVAVIIGSSGGIGGAITNILVQNNDYNKIYTFNRNIIPNSNNKIINGYINFNDESSISTAVKVFKNNNERIDLLFVCSGILHDKDSSIYPEKSLNAINLSSMQKVFLINTFGPTMVAKYFFPHLTKDNKAIFAVISAKIGSIEDNYLGGWYSYRASKSALNMIVKNLAIESLYKRPKTICVAIHPGTVDTNLSKPYQNSVDNKKLFSAEQSAEYLINVLDNLNIEDSGKLFAWDGSIIPY